MRFYERVILPRLVHVTCASRPVMKQRAKVVPAARGRVLEIGFGSGLNLPFYDSGAVERVWALEPSREMWRLARPRVERAPFPVEHVEAGADRIPLDAGAADTIVVTYTLCTIPEAVPAVAEMRRVLRPGGRLLFSEHGAAPDEPTRKWQRRLDPIWSRLSGGCHLDRAIPDLLEEGGFRAHEISASYIPGWKPASYHYWGAAVPS
ncbi:MAG TPA: class I SAM-dependent methyltransferase [Thermoanaerobaculia bacterium]